MVPPEFLMVKNHRNTINGMISRATHKNRRIGQIPISEKKRNCQKGAALKQNFIVNNLMITLVENSSELRGILRFTRFCLVYKFYFVIIINANYGICVIAAALKVGVA
jgi:hypothetical protein